MEGDAVAGFECITIACMNGHGQLMRAPVDVGQRHMGAANLLDPGFAIESQA